MNARHTPGPWIKHGSGVYSAKAKDGKFYAEMSVAACHTDEDARLIASSPRMLAALKRVAHILAELPAEVQSPQVLALRCEIIDAIKEAAPEYYGVPA